MNPINLIITTGKYKEPKIIKNIYYYKTNITEYKYFIRILFKKIPITGKEYSMINNILKRYKCK